MAKEIETNEEAAGVDTSTSDSPFDFAGIFAKTSTPVAVTEEKVVEAEGQNDPPLVDEDEEVLATPPPSPVDSAPALAAITESNRALAAAVEAMRTREATPAAPDADAPSPFSSFTINPASLPAELTTLLNSEDPAERQKGLVALISSAVSMGLARVQDHVTKTYQPQFEAYVQQQFVARAQAEKTKLEFDTAYPGLTSSDQGRTVAQLTVQSVVQEMQAAGLPASQMVWGAAGTPFRVRFDAKLKALGYKGKAVPAVAAPAPASVSRGNGGARAIAPGAKTLGDDILAVVKSF